MAFFQEAAERQLTALDFEIDPTRNLQRRDLEQYFEDAWMIVARQEGLPAKGKPKGRAVGLVFSAMDIGEEELTVLARKAIPGLTALSLNGLEASTQDKEGNGVKIRIGKIALHMLWSLGKELKLPLAGAMDRLRTDFLQEQEAKETRLTEEDRAFPRMPREVLISELEAFLVGVAVETLPAESTPSAPALEGEQKGEPAGAEAPVTGAKPVETKPVAKAPMWVRRVLQIGQEEVWKQDNREAKQPEKVTRFQIAKALALVWLSSNEKVQQHIERVVLTLYGDNDELPFSPLTKLASGRILMQDCRQRLDELLNGQAIIDFSIAPDLLRRICLARMQASGVPGVLPDNLFQSRYFKPEGNNSGILRPGFLAMGALSELTERFARIQDQAGVDRARGLVEVLALALEVLGEKRKAQLLRVIETQEKKIQSRQEEAQRLDSFFSPQN